FRVERHCTGGARNRRTPRTDPLKHRLQPELHPRRTKRRCADLSTAELEVMRSQTTAVASVALLFGFAASVFCLRRVDRIRTGSTLQEVLYISSPETLRRVSLGYSGLMADIYWTRAVQYFGSKHHAGGGRYDLLAPLLEITTTLDPH